MQRRTSSRPVGSRPSLSTTISRPSWMAAWRTWATGAMPWPNEAQASPPLPSLRWMTRVRSLCYWRKATGSLPAAYTQ